MHQFLHYTMLYESSSICGCDVGPKDLQIVGCIDAMFSFLFIQCCSQRRTAWYLIKMIKGII